MGRTTGIRLANLPRVLRYLLLLTAACLLFAILEFTTGLPSGVADRVHLEARKLRSQLARVPLSDLGICRCGPDRDVTLARSDGIRTRASIYESDASVPGPALLLLHGSTSLGRKMPLYRVLATTFAEHGYTVMSLDLPGFGESDDPSRVPKHDLLAGELEFVALGLSELLSSEQVDPARLLVFGHSRGSATALAAGLSMEGVTDIALWTPSRTVLLDELDSDYWDYRWKKARRIHQTVYGVAPGEWLTRETFIDQIRNRPKLTDYADGSFYHRHKPMLLLFGEHESRRKIEILTDFCATHGDPVECAQLDRSDHYGNSQILLNFTVYDRKVVSALIEAVKSWQETR